MTFEWIGDLNDAASCHAGPLVACVECLYGPEDDDEPDNTAMLVWHATVDLFYRVAGEPPIFDSNVQDVVPKTGAAARWLCELVMRDWRANHGE